MMINLIIKKTKKQKLQQIPTTITVTQTPTISQTITPSVTNTPVLTDGYINGSYRIDFDENEVGVPVGIKKICAIN